MNIILTALLTLQGQSHPKVDQAKVDAAIDQSCSFLKGHLDFVMNKDVFMSWEKTNPGSFHQRCQELVLLTLHYGGVSPEDEIFKKLLEAVLAAPIETTYRAALQAMALSKIDAKKYQSRIAQCGQALVDSQAQNGQWCYGHPTDTPVPPARDIQTKGKETAVLPKIALAKKKPGCPHGDNSNSQYAALGLRACIESNVEIPIDVLKKAKEAWERSQKADGSWDYGTPSNVRQSVQPPGTYGSMTVGGIAALSILKYYLKETVKGDSKIVAAMNWVGRNFSTSENPGYQNHHVFYWLYGLERAGDLYGVDKFGAHDWYAEGANWLLEKQQPDGQWNQTKLENNIAATCFAVLFLRRATAPLPKISTGKGK
jgi:hypothetical protein